MPKYVSPNTHTLYYLRLPAGWAADCRQMMMVMAEKDGAWETGRGHGELSGFAAVLCPAVAVFAAAAVRGQASPGHTGSAAVTAAAMAVAVRAVCLCRGRPYACRRRGEGPSCRSLLTRGLGQ